MASHANAERGGTNNYTMMQFFESVLSSIICRGPSDVQQSLPSWIADLDHRWYAEGGGVHWKKYETESKKLGDMGITACWLPRK